MSFIMEKIGSDIQPIQLDIADDKLNAFLTIVNNLKNDILLNQDEYDSEMKEFIKTL